MIKNLSEKELGHAFFYSLKINDLEHAYYLLKLGAPINTSYFINRDELVYTISIFFCESICRSCCCKNCWDCQEEWVIAFEIATDAQDTRYLSRTETWSPMPLHSKKSPLLRPLPSLQIHKIRLRIRSVHLGQPPNPKTSLPRRQLSKSL